MGGGSSTTKFLRIHRSTSQGTAPAGRLPRPVPPEEVGYHCDDKFLINTILLEDTIPVKWEVPPILPAHVIDKCEYNRLVPCSFVQILQINIVYQPLHPTGYFIIEWWPTFHLVDESPVLAPPPLRFGGVTVPPLKAPYP